MMPRFFPENIEELFYPKHARFKERSSAERQTFECLKEHLRGQYDVYYSVRWLHKPTHSGGRDGEADFVIVHPDYGILIMEVKGGGISRHNGRWYSTDARRKRHAIKDPYEQAMESKWALLKKIKAIPAFRDHWLDAGHSVIFPDCEMPGHGLGSDAPTEITIFTNEMPRIGQRVDHIFKYWQEHQSDRKHKNRNGKDIQESIRQILAPDFQLQFSLRNRMAGEEKQFIRLTQEQYRVLDYLSKTPRVLVSGGAGTGKTTLAIEKARRLAHEGFETLLFCLHPNLADEMRAAVHKVKNLMILSLPELIQNMYTRKVEPNPTDIPLNSIDAFLQTANPVMITQRIQQSAEYMQAWLNQNPTGLEFPAPDALVLDEGHLLGEPLWQALTKLLKTPDQDIVYIFYDPELCLYSDPIQEPGILPGLVPITLSRNLRNTRSITQLARIFQPRLQPDADAPEGQPIEFHEIQNSNTPDERLQALEEILKDLINNRKIQPESIALLRYKNDAASCLQMETRLAGVRIAGARQANGSTLLLSNPQEFSGTERPLIILFELDALIEDARQSMQSNSARILYYLITRARSHLIWLGTQSNMNWLKFKWQELNPS